MPYAPGQSGNLKGAPRRAQRRTLEIRKLIGDKSGAIIKKTLEQAEAGDVAAMQLAYKYLLPRMQRFIPAPIEMPLIESLEIARQQIARLAVMGATGELDLESMTAISRTICLAAGLRLSELEDILCDREDEAASQVRRDH